MVKKYICIALFLVSGACQRSEAPAGPVAPPSAPPPPELARRAENDPTTPEILKRPVATQVSHVKQVLVTYDRANPRFPVPTRNLSEAIAKVNEVLALHRKGVPFDDLMRQHSDDPETGPAADSLFMEAEGTPGSTRQLALRLAVGEVGVVQTGNAFHIMLRIPEPPEVPSPDSADILAREPVTKSASFKSINIAWRGLKQVYLTQITEGALKRSQGQAAQLAREILDKVRAGGSFDDLITQYGEKIPMPEESHNHQWVLTGMKPGSHFEPHGDHTGHDHGAADPQPDGHQHGPGCGHGGADEPAAPGGDHAGHDHAGHDHAGHDHDAPGMDAPKKGLPNKSFTSGGLKEVPEVGKLSLRLQVGEAGIVTSRYGYHVVLRVR